MAKYKNVTIGNNSVIEEGVIIGLPPFGKEDGELETIIGDNAYIRAHTVIYAGVKIGNNFQTGPGVLIREDNIIGDNVVIWHGSTLNPENKIGNNTRIHAGCFLEMADIGENVFFGPGVIFTTYPHPDIPIRDRECWDGAHIENGAAIGGNVTLLPHITIGKNAVIGAGSVVVDDIPSGKVAVGNPAKIVKDIKDVICNRSGREHYPYKDKQ